MKRNLRSFFIILSFWVAGRLGIDLLLGDFDTSARYIFGHLFTGILFAFFWMIISSMSRFMEERW